MSGKVREDAVLEVIEALIEIFHLIDLFLRVFLAHLCESSENCCGVLQEVKDLFLAGPEKNAVSLVVGQALFLVIFGEQVQVLLIGGLVFGKRRINELIDLEPDLDFVLESPWLDVLGLEAVGEVDIVRVI